jgi:uncharacterized protein (DUF1778 family)
MAKQISVKISESTRELLENFAKNTGIRKGFLIEQAVLSYIRALEQLPADVFVPAKIVLSPAAATRIVKHCTRPPKPRRQLRRLMSDED